MTDGWAAYNEIGNYDGGIYLNDVVIHQTNFVNPQDSDVHTQSVESMWRRAKRKLRQQGGTSVALFPSYLAEFMWQMYVKPDVDGFLAIVKEILINYP